MTDQPPPLGERLHALVTELAASDGLLLALDLDGTLAPIVDDPADARVPDATRETLDALDAHDRVTVAAVSGRALDDLRERVDATAYAGNHGLELADRTGTQVADEAAAARDAVAAVCDALDDRLAAVDGAFVERKGVTATIHYRQVDPGAVPTVERAVREVVDGHDALRVTGGKQILEIRPAVDWDKGDAVEWLVDAYVPDDERWTAIYVGDDRTDEDAFAALEALGHDGDGRALPTTGIGVAVGDGPSRASYRVRDPGAVADLLSWLTDYGVAFLDRDQAVPISV